MVRHTMRDKHWPILHSRFCIVLIPLLCLLNTPCMSDCFTSSHIYIASPSKTLIHSLMSSSSWKVWKVQLFIDPFSSALLEQYSFMNPQFVLNSIVIKSSSVNEHMINYEVVKLFHGLLTWSIGLHQNNIQTVPVLHLRGSFVLHLLWIGVCRQLAWGVTLKMCHWINVSICPEPPRSPTDTSRSASDVQASRRSRLHGATSLLRSLGWRM